MLAGFVLCQPESAQIRCTRAACLCRDEIAHVGKQMLLLSRYMKPPGLDAAMSKVCLQSCELVRPGCAQHTVHVCRGSVTHSSLAIASHECGVHCIGLPCGLQRLQSKHTVQQ